ncbi:uncharacterized protein JN550_000538 [Neoarthrinium moseri]|uniref:uncharacterized protein n=1 Tax=Neoarthrinium moseri TaxID=1658444 RepID=UPI001FDC1C49|nr:uncharacterized protein JN550_000538 [Neoarthrinium moseri]KAI1878356.1 hypothetical protein JN550_000538 [Neoarthrinium moseri]
MARLIAFGLSIFVALVALLGTSFLPSVRHVWSYYHDTPHESGNHELPEPAKPVARIFLYDPLIIHIADLITPDERKYLRELAYDFVPMAYSKFNALTLHFQTSLPRLKRSSVDLDGAIAEQSRRTNSTAFLPFDDVAIRRIMARVNEFQGYMEHYRINVQITSYQEGQEYRPHFDWYEDDEYHINHFSTIFAILEASCEHCGTQFPRIKVDWTKRDKKWCEYLDCSQNVLTTKNINSSALFWRNLDDNLRGRPDTLHAGLPAKDGSKMGLNIWTEIATS